MDLAVVIDYVVAIGVAITSIGLSILLLCVIFLQVKTLLRLLLD